MSDPKDDEPKDDEPKDTGESEADEETAEVPYDPTMLAGGDKKSLAYGKPADGEAARDPTKTAEGDKKSLTYGAPMEGDEPRDPTLTAAGDKKSLTYGTPPAGVAPVDPTKTVDGDKTSLAFEKTAPVEDAEPEYPPSWHYGEGESWNPTATEAEAAPEMDPGMDERDTMASLEDATDVLDFNPGESLGFRLGSLLRAVLPGAQEPEVNYNFIVLIGAFPFGDFHAVENVQYKVDPLEYKEGGRNFSPRLLPYETPSKRGELVLKWGTVVWSTLYDWINDVEVGGSFRREVFVVQLSRDGWPTRLMRFGNCWPIEWKAADLDTSDSKWAMESVTLVYERFNMVMLRGLTSIL